MKRIPEPELMDEIEQVRAYAEADFEEPNSLFVSLFKERFPGHDMRGVVLDLGCGPGDISMRFAREYPDCLVHALDGSGAMLNFGKGLLEKEVGGVRQRVRFIHAVLPAKGLPGKTYDVIISNSLLHHLRDPSVLWDTIRGLSRGGTAVCVMDLFRPSTTEEAGEIVQRYADGEPDVLRRDFYNSLCAAFEVEEVLVQLGKAGLGCLTVEVVSDRHMLVSGLIKPT